MVQKRGKKSGEFEGRAEDFRDGGFPGENFIDSVTEERSMPPLIASLPEATLDGICAGTAADRIGFLRPDGDDFEKSGPPGEASTRTVEAASGAAAGLALKPRVAKSECLLRGDLIFL